MGSQIGLHLQGSPSTAMSPVTSREDEGGECCRQDGRVDGMEA